MAQHGSARPHDGHELQRNRRIIERQRAVTVIGEDRRVADIAVGQRLDPTGEGFRVQQPGVMLE